MARVLITNGASVAELVFVSVSVCVEDPFTFPKPSVPAPKVGLGARPVPDSATLGVYPVLLTMVRLADPAPALVGE